MGKYDSFLLGKALFVHLSRIYFTYFILQLHKPVHVEISGYLLCSNTDHGGTHGEHIGHCHPSNLGHPERSGCSHVVFPGKPSQEKDFYSKQ